MFDLRYHVASLAAVFFALVIGILVGVALASHGLGTSERKRLEEDVRRAQATADTLQAQLDTLNRAGAADQSFVESTYSAVMADRLKGKRIAVIFVGSKSVGVQGEVTKAIKDADGAVLRTYALQVPIDETAVAKRLTKRPFLASYAGADQLDNLGKALGQEFVVGNETPLWNALQSVLVQEATPRVGAARRPADGVIVVRTAEPQTGPTAPLVRGLYAGLADAGVPAVGVALSDEDFSAKKVFQETRPRVYTVDDVDLPAGKLALVLLLSDPSSSGAVHDFGVSGDALLPAVAPVSTGASG